MTMITPSYLGETIEYSSLHACRSTLEDPTLIATLQRRLAKLEVKRVDVVGSDPSIVPFMHFLGYELTGGQFTLRR